MIKVCTSCGKRTTEYTILKCPKCGTEIVRCNTCRSNFITYTCPKCGFEGP